MVNDGLEHIDHLVGIVLADHLIHHRLEVGHHLTVAVLDARDEHRRIADAVVGKGRIGAHHLPHAGLVSTETERQ